MKEKRYWKKTAAVCFAIALAVIASVGIRVSAEEKKVSRDVFAMDTYMSLTAYGDHADEALEAAVREINRLEALLSVTSPDSEVSRLNARSFNPEGGDGLTDASGNGTEPAASTQNCAEAGEEDPGSAETGGPGESIAEAGEEAPDIAEAGETSSSAEESFPLSDDTAALMETSLRLYQETGGAFDITILPLMQLWGFPTKEYRVPPEEEIMRMRTLVGADAIRYDSGAKEVAFSNRGTRIDFGGIAKGYTSERVIQIFRENGVTSGIVSLGGNVQALGHKPDGSNWKIAIQDPDHEGRYLGIIQTADRAVITSGGYERYFESDGKRYHHILDPATGYPADSGLVSVSVISEDGTKADGLSTALFVMGESRAADFWRDHKEEFDYVLLTEDGRLLATEGLKDSFSSEYATEWVEAS